MRWDPGVGRRSRVDFTDLSWQRRRNDWQLRVGIREVFWSVTESLNVVDVIDQQDLIENGAGYTKLGQPIVNLTVMRDWGTIDFLCCRGSENGGSSGGAVASGLHCAYTPTAPHSNPRHGSGISTGRCGGPTQSATGR